jgi:hypothetical protein
LGAAKDKQKKKKQARSSSQPLDAGVRICILYTRKPLLAFSFIYKNRYSLWCWCWCWCSVCLVPSPFYCRPCFYFFGRLLYDSLGQQPSTDRLFARLLLRFFFLLTRSTVLRISVDSHNRKESRSCRRGEYYVTAFGRPMRKSVTAVDLLLCHSGSVPADNAAARGQCRRPPIAFVRRNPPTFGLFCCYDSPPFDCLMDQEKNPLGHFFRFFFFFLVLVLAHAGKRGKRRRKLT